MADYYMNRPFSSDDFIRSYEIIKTYSRIYFSISLFNTSNGNFLEHKRISHNTKSSVVQNIGGHSLCVCSSSSSEIKN